MVVQVLCFLLGQPHTGAKVDITWWIGYTRHQYSSSKKELKGMIVVLVFATPFCGDFGI